MRQCVEDGIRIQGGLGTVSNSGRIIATGDDAVALFSGGNITNAAGAVINSVGTMIPSATIGTYIAVGTDIFVTGGKGTLVNAGTMTAGVTGILMNNPMTSGSFTGSTYLALIDMQGLLSAKRDPINAHKVDSSVNLQAGFLPDPYTVGLTAGGQKQVTINGVSMWVANEHTPRVGVRLAHSFARGECSVERRKEQHGGVAV